MAAMAEEAGSGMCESGIRAKMQRPRRTRDKKASELIGRKTNQDIAGRLELGLGGEVAGQAWPDKWLYGVDSVARRYFAGTPHIFSWSRARWVMRIAGKVNRGLGGMGSAAMSEERVGVD